MNVCVIIQIHPTLGRFVVLNGMTPVHWRNMIIHVQHLIHGKDIRLPVFHLPNLQDEHSRH